MSGPGCACNSVERTGLLLPSDHNQGWRQGWGNCSCCRLWDSSEAPEPQATAESPGNETVCLVVNPSGIPGASEFLEFRAGVLTVAMPTSSLAILMLSVTSEKTVGLMNSPLSSMADPPHSSLAPSFFPLSISSSILSNCFWSI